MKLRHKIANMQTWEVPVATQARTNGSWPSLSQFDPYFALTCETMFTKGKRVQFQIVQCQLQSETVLSYHYED